MTHVSAPHPARPAAAGKVAYIRNDTPTSFRVVPNGVSSVGRELFAGSSNSSSIARRAAETREWLKKMRKEVRQARRKGEEEEKSASLLCSVLRASSALMTEKAAGSRPSSRADPRRFHFALYSFLDGTPFLTPQSLCRYNTALAEALSDEQLDLIRCHVFNYDEEAFADLLYADVVADSLEQHVPYGGDVSVPEFVRRFNESSRRALERLVAAPGGLADATILAAYQVPIVDDVANVADYRE
ncbi:uncharacterized protein Tco025E_02968 [Trypanosoma conorhini]|uniref:Uncharacterized protein n=1 Tax=Trypanosoma conorhini TaxID=83891 RepID=A0A3R7LY05_9TRYP|nr:uncharacterized protein Tco025E_02968 [Trypanosoma conorhini]RNF22903.1 hypothetical protein Tco025E_02968 [Trypanosoma conorhini]